MPIGIQPTKQEIDTRISNAVTSLKGTIMQVRAFNADLMRLPDTSLQNMGYTADEVTTIHDLSAKLEQLYEVFTGAAALPAPVNFSETFAPFWGVGL